MAIVLSLSLSKHSTSDVVLTAWPKGQQFYLGESIVLTCKVEGNSSEVWNYSWLRHNLSKASTPSRAYRVNHHTYSISALTYEDSGMYQCRAQDTNSTFQSNPVSLNVTAASPPASLEVWPNSSQHLQGEHFSLRCSVHGGETAGWILRRLRGAEVNSGCSEMEGRVNSSSSDECSFNNITSGLSGLYWCGEARGDQRSNAINITVSGISKDHSEEENTFIGAWVWAICVMVIILLLIPITFLLVPSLRKRVKFFPKCREYNAHQEMPRTKQDVTEIQWDLAWMEMTNLLDKPYPGS
ncbi:hypothetical protein PDJAM_G00110210 [Pangasius djambal]|uniref:Uncharacterized protein n=1 Tax=Pangasius djambal TaxID=1691987 RepID=A0ACC5Y236_9TELE|nr:hypothetical protein [Pangasius djambal]